MELIQPPFHKLNDSPNHDRANNRLIFFVFSIYRFPKWHSIFFQQEFQTFENSPHRIFPSMPNQYYIC